MKQLSISTLVTGHHYYGPNSKILFGNTQEDVEGASAISKEMREAEFFVTASSLRDAGFDIELLSDTTESISVWDVDEDGRILLAWRAGKRQDRMSCIVIEADETFAGWILGQWETVAQDTAPHRSKGESQSPQLSASLG